MHHKFINSFGDYYNIDTNTVIYCDVKEHFLEIFCEEDISYFVNTSLKEIKKSFGDNFFRCNKSCLINISHIKKFLPGELKIICKNNKEIIVSRRKKPELIKLLNSHNENGGGKFHYIRQLAIVKAD